LEPTSRITIYIDNDVIDEVRNRAEAAGYGYQTMINEALRQYIQKSGKPLDESVIRRVIREELGKAVVQ
jgi:BrnA antitoxin of type II toxin-antitoxin system